MKSKGHVWQSWGHGRGATAPEWGVWDGPKGHQQGCVCSHPLNAARRSSGTDPSPGSCHTEAWHTARLASWEAQGMGAMSDPAAGSRVCPMMC